MKADANAGVLLQCGFILHQRSYTDSRVLLELFTARDGRITAVARRQAKLLPAQFLLFQLQLLDCRGASDLKTLRTCEPADPRPFPLQGKLHFCGLYLNELLIRVLMPAAPQPGLFALYEQSLRALSASSTLKEAEPVLRVFELALLRESGLAFDYQHDYQTGLPIVPQRCYELHLEGGFAETSALSDAKRGVFQGGDLLAIGNSDFSREGVLQAAKQVTRLALAPLLGDKPLKSRELFL